MTDDRRWRWLRDGEEVGPFTSVEVRKLIGTGILTQQAIIIDDQGRRLRIGSLKVTGSGKAQVGRPSKDAASDKGKVEQIPPPPPLPPLVPRARDANNVGHSNSSGDITRLLRRRRKIRFWRVALLVLAVALVLIWTGRFLLPFFLPGDTGWTKLVQDVVVFTLLAATLRLVVLLRRSPVIFGAYFLIPIVNLCTLLHLSNLAKRFLEATSGHEGNEPHTSSGFDFIHGNIASESEALRIARGHERVAICFALLLPSALAIWGAVIGWREMWVKMALVYTLLCLAYIAWWAFSMAGLAAALKRSPWLFGFAAAIPGLNIVAALHLTQRSAQILDSVGIPNGILGCEIPESLRPPYRTLAERIQGWTSA